VWSDGRAEPRRGRGAQRPGLDGALPACPGTRCRSVETLPERVEALCKKSDDVALLAQCLCLKSEDVALLAQCLCLKSDDVALLAQRLPANLPPPDPLLPHRKKGEEISEIRE
jgi:hypothetical protein